MKLLSRASCMIMTMVLMLNVAGVTPAMAGVSLLPKKGAINEPVQSKNISADAKAKAEVAYNKRPISFESNRGQTDAKVKFLARGKGYMLFLTAKEAVMALQTPSSKVAGDVVRVSLKGSNADPLVQGMDALPGHSNYFSGNDPKKWQTNVEQYSKVEYKQVYPGIDMVYYGNQGQLEYDFVVAAGANPGLIRMDFKGTRSLELDKQGNLVLNFKTSRMAFGAPVLYQKTGDTRQPVDGHYVLAGNKQVCFAVGAYDKSKELIIDPSVLYSTYLGTTLEDEASAMAVGSTGIVYLTGQTASTTLFPAGSSVGKYPSGNGGAFDAFVIKLSATGAVLWSTYLGGTLTDRAGHLNADGNLVGNSIAVDGSNNVYITGETTSGNFPTKNPYQLANNGTGGHTNAFVAAIKADGSDLLYSTYLGGSGPDFGTGIAVDSSGNAFVTGGMFSANSSWLGGHPVSLIQDENGATDNATPNIFVTRYNSAGQMQYFTYYGGATKNAGMTQGNAIAIDSNDNAYVTGATVAGFIVKPTGSFAGGNGSFKQTMGGAQDAFVMEINPSGSSLLYASYLGGGGNAIGYGIAVDKSNPPYVYVAGDNDSGDFPDNANAFPTVGQTTIAGTYNGFIMKMVLNSTAHGDGKYCTFLGGNGLDHLSALAVDTFGFAYVTGHATPAGTFVTGVTGAPAPLQTLTLTGVGDLNTVGGTGKAFVSAIGLDGTTRLLNSCFGGVSDQAGQGIATDSAGNIYVAGWTTSSTAYPTGFPTFGSAPMPLFSANAGAGGTFDAFVMKIAPTSSTSLPTITSVTPPTGVIAGGTTVVIGGTNFTGISGATGVKFGSTAATSYIVNSSTQITAIAPAHLVGPVDIVAKSPAGSSAVVPADVYTYFVAASTLAPTVTKLNPKIGATFGGTTVVITGTDFSSVPATNGVKFGDLYAASYVVNSNTQITAKTKAHLFGIVDVVVTNAYGSSALVLADQYTYFFTPGSDSGADVYFDPFVFPSPTKGSTAGIAYYMESAGLVKIRIYNEIGRLVNDLQEYKSAHTQGSVISVADLAPGVYLCLISAEYSDGTTKKYSKIKFAVIH